MWNYSEQNLAHIIEWNLVMIDTKGRIISMIIYTRWTNGWYHPGIGGPPGLDIRLHVSSCSRRVSSQTWFEYYSSYRGTISRLKRIMNNSFSTFPLTRIFDNGQIHNKNVCERERAYRHAYEYIIRTTSLLY